MSTEVLELGRPIMSGHCGFPETANPDESHARCDRTGAGSTANPAKLFHPCPCACHLGGEFECECGGIIREAPALGLDEDGDMQYVHVDDQGRLTFEGCRT